MKVSFIEVPRSMVKEFELFKTLNPRDIEETGKVRISYRLESKTRVSTSMQCKMANNTINWNIDGYNLYEHTKITYFDGSKITEYFFKKSKKQGYQQYLEYLEVLVPKVLHFLKVDENAEIVVEIERKNSVWQ